MSKDGHNTHNVTTHNNVVELMNLCVACNALLMRNVLNLQLCIFTCLKLTSTSL